MITGTHLDWPEQSPYLTLDDRIWFKHLEEAIILSIAISLSYFHFYMSKVKV